MTQEATQEATQEKLPSTSLTVQEPITDVVYHSLNKKKEKLLPLLRNDEARLEKILRALSWEINTKDKLDQCTPISMLDCAYQCCEYNLDPAAVLGQVWLIPYKQKDGRYKLTMQVGYRGWLKLLLSNDKVANIYSYPVYKGDEFEYTLGLDLTLKHKPIAKERDIEDLICTYGVVKLTNGEKLLKVCYKAEIERSRKASKTYKTPNKWNDLTEPMSIGPWGTDYEAMALLIPIRKIGKNLGIPLKNDNYDT